MRAAITLLIGVLPAIADVCAPADIQGAYGFQLSGISAIAGKPAPVGSIGRLVFDADGKVAGTSSVNFNGLFLGNPVTGTYQAQTDCTVTWKLQDDSGGWQNFAGKATPGGARIDFHQADAGAGARGTMVRLSPACTDAAFSGTYSMTMSGVSTPLARGLGQSADTANTRVQADGGGQLMLVWSDTQTSGTYKVDDECFVNLEFGLPGGSPAQLRGILVDSGNLVLAVHSDPQVVGTARLRR